MIWVLVRPNARSAVSDPPSLTTSVLFPVVIATVTGAAMLESCPKLLAGASLPTLTTSPIPMFELPIVVGTDVAMTLMMSLPSGEASLTQ